MEFDKSRVYTTLNAGELKAGSKVVAADTLSTLKKRVKELGSDGSGKWPLELVEVEHEDEMNRFSVSDGAIYVLAYLVEEPNVPALKWTDLKPGDVIRAAVESPELIYNTIRCLVTSIDDDPDTMQHIYAGGRWIGDGDLKSYIKEE